MMTVGITRLDISAASLRVAAKQTSDAAAARRMLAIAMVLDGQRRGDAARQSGMDRQTLRDWVHRFNEQGLAGLSDRDHGGGARRALSIEQETEVADWVRTGPDFGTDGVVRWRRADLRERIRCRFSVALHERSVGKLLRRLGFRRISVRPAHPRGDLEARETHKKNFPIWSTTPSPRPRAASQSNFGGRMKPVSGSKAV